MGRGGDSSFIPPVKVLVPKHVLANSPLAHCPEEELRKYAEQRGLKSDGSREDLLIKLKPFAKVRIQMAFIAVLRGFPLGKMCMSVE